MNFKLKNKIYIIGFIALLLSSIQQIIFLIRGFIVYIGFIADILIIICAILIRFKLINKEILTEVFKKTDIVEEDSSKSQLNPNRFINGMVLAMVFGTIASITIHYNFTLGVLIYFIMQIVHIWAFSGIIHYNPKLVFGTKAKSVKKISIISTISFLIIVPILFMILIIPGWGFIAFFILPYVLSLVLMVLITYWGLGYSSRPIKFRLMLCIGASFFFFSDLMIGYTAFSNSFYLAPLTIYSTYILAIFLMQFAILQLNGYDNKKK